jgi:hypothetical protein
MSPPPPTGRASTLAAAALLAACNSTSPSALAPAQPGASGEPAPAEDVGAIGSPASDPSDAPHGSAGTGAADEATTTADSSGAPAGPPVGVSASVAMTQAGTLREKELVAEVNRQRGSVQRCGPLVRRTDPVVGSLNLQLSIDAAGRVTPDLQSPVNDEAKACLLAAARGWRIRGAGSGEAMLLLVLDDAAGP